MSEPQTNDTPPSNEPEAQASTGLPTLVPPATWEPLEPAPASPRRRWLAWVVGLIVLLVLLGVTVVVWQSQLLPDAGTVTRLESGVLQVRDNQDGPWFTAGAERLVRQNARLRAGDETVAWLSFDDGAQMRIESAGEWRLMTTQRSRNQRISRLTIEHVDGRASYIAPLPQRLRDARLTISMQGASLELAGVATVTLAENMIVITMLDGQAALTVYQRRVPLLKGETVRVDLAQRQVIRE